MNSRRPIAAGVKNAWVRPASSAVSNESGIKSGTTIPVAPDAAARSAHAWNIRFESRIRSPGLQSISAKAFWVWTSMLCWVSTIPLGRPVLPEL